MGWKNQFVSALGNTIYPYAKRPMPTPGFKDRAIYPAFSLPAFSIQGRGYIYGFGRGPTVVSPYPQMNYTQAQVITGLNGLVYGGQHQQALINLEDYLKDSNPGSAGAS